jgi:hypothetical protein
MYDFLHPAGIAALAFPKPGALGNCYKAGEAYPAGKKRKGQRREANDQRPLTRCLVSKCGGRKDKVFRWHNAKIM